MTHTQDARLSEQVRFRVSSQYRESDRLVVRRAAYDEVAVHQEGDGRSVYLTRGGTVRLALALLREAFR